MVIKLFFATCAANSGRAIDAGRPFGMPSGSRRGSDGPRTASARRPIGLPILSGLFLAAFCAGALLPGSLKADELRVAVASNFAEVLETMGPVFARESGHQLILTAGSTGKFYAQIKAGAPFDVLLAADQERPRRLAAEGAGLVQSLFTYATGRLALWSADPGRIDKDGPALLRDGRHRFLAIANPKLAPYGAAAREVLQELGLWEREQARLVQGENVGQVFALVATGNADLGFVALSQVLSPRNDKAADHWRVPARLHRPIRQDGIILLRAKGNPAAWAFVDFLKGPAAQAVMKDFGYVPESGE